MAPIPDVALGGVLTTQRAVLASDGQRTPGQVVGRQAPDASGCGCRTSDSAPRRATGTTARQARGRAVDHRIALLKPALMSAPSEKYSAEPAMAASIW